MLMLTKAWNCFHMCAVFMLSLSLLAKLCSAASVNSKPPQTRHGNMYRSRAVRLTAAAGVLMDCVEISLHVDLRLDET